MRPSKFALASIAAGLAINAALLVLRPLPGAAQQSTSAWTEPISIPRWQWATTVLQVFAANWRCNQPWGPYQIAYSVAPEGTVTQINLVSVSASNVTWERFSTTPEGQTIKQQADQNRQTAATLLSTWGIASANKDNIQQQWVTLNSAVGQEPVSASVPSRSIADSDIEVHATWHEQGVSGFSILAEGTVTNTGNAVAPTVELVATVRFLALGVADTQYKSVTTDTFKNLKPGESRSFRTTIPSPIISTGGTVLGLTFAGHVR